MRGRRGIGCFGLIALIGLVAGAYMIITAVNPGADFSEFLAFWADRISSAWRAAWQILSAPQ